MEKRSIPLIIHQMWLDKIKKENDIPLKYKELKYSQKLCQLNPQFQYKLWNQLKVDMLFESNSNLVKWKNFYYNIITDHMERCDFARYMIMYIEGGIYLDLDFECFKNLEPLLKNREIGLVYNPKEMGCEVHKTKQCIANGFIISKPLHFFWIQFMDYIMEHYGLHPNTTMTEKVLHNTGPYALTNFVLRNGFDENKEWFIDTCLILALTGSPLTLAKDCTDRGLSLKDAYVVTYWKDGTNWHDKNNTLLTNSNQAKKQNILIVIFALFIFLLVVLIIILSLYIHSNIYGSTNGFRNNRNGSNRNDSNGNDINRDNS